MCKGALTKLEKNGKSEKNGRVQIFKNSIQGINKNGQENRKMNQKCNCRVRRIKGIRFEWIRQNAEELEYNKRT